MMRRRNLAVLEPRNQEEALLMEGGPRAQKRMHSTLGVSSSFSN
jgi:hypothetical protein